MVGVGPWAIGDILIIGASAQVADYPLVLETYASHVDTDKAAMMLPSTEARSAPGALVANAGIVFYLAGSWQLVGATVREPEGDGARPFRTHR